MSTLRVGTEALEGSKLSLNEVDDIMGRLEEYKGYEEDLSSAMTLGKDRMICFTDHQFRKYTFCKISNI